MGYPVIHSEDVAHVRLTGELTFAEHRKFRRTVANLEQKAPKKVRLDLSGVAYIDAAGLGLLLVTSEAVSRQGGRVELHGAQGQVGRMLTVAKISQLFEPAA